MPAVDASDEIENWTCIPGKKVGKIAKNFSEKDVIEAYGVENVERKEIGLGEGEMANATVLFPNTDNQLFITWQLDKQFEVIDEILIDEAKTSWMTSQGITVGTTLKELVNINEKPFQFAGFEWDYSGFANDWQGGKISKNLSVFLEPSNPEAVYPDLLGDALFSSDLPKAKEADLKVRAMIIRFDQ